MTDFIKWLLDIFIFLKNTFKKNNNLISILVIYLYALGYYSFFSIYKSFKIDIIPYISLNEVLIKTIDYSFSVLLIACTIELFLILTIGYIIRVCSKKTNYSNPHIYLIISIISFLLLFYSIFLHFTDKLNLAYYILNISLMFLMVNMFFYLSTSNKSIDNKDIKTQSKNIKRFKYLVCIAIFPIILFFIEIYNLQITKNIKDGKSQKNIEIISNDNIYYSTLDNKINFNNDSLVFIGQTSSAIFLYNKSQRKTLIIYTNNIKEYKIHIE